MKCRLGAADTVCERCTRKSIDCVFEKHRRGRKPTRSLLSFDPSSINRDWFINRPKLKLRESESSSALVGYSDGPVQEQSPQAQYSLHSESQENTIWTSRTRANESPVDERWNISDSLQPSKLLSKGAQSGHFSLQNVLSISSLLTSDGSSHSERQNRISRISSNLDDPISCNILSYPTALGLFEK